MNKTSEINVKRYHTSENLALKRCGKSIRETTIREINETETWDITWLNHLKEKVTKS
jgi:hypothetical protein